MLNIMLSVVWTLDLSVQAQGPDFNDETWLG